MAKDIEVSWSYSEVKGDPVHDVEFYRSLPGMTEQFSATDGILGRASGPEFSQVIYWGGSAVLSSSILAAAIKAYVALKKRKVTVSIGNKKLEYEGSDLKHDMEAIEAMIDKLSDEESTASVKIHARRL